MYSLAPHAVADHVRHQHRGPHHLLHHAFRLPDAHHSGRKTRISGEQMSWTRPTHRRSDLLLLLAGNASLLGPPFLRF